MSKFIGLDTGERAGKTVAVWDAEPSPAWDLNATTTVKFFHDPVAALQDPHFEAGDTVITESSTCNFDPEMRRQFLSVAKERGLLLYPINPRHTKSRSRDYGVSKSDKNDAWVLLQIKKEGIIPYTKHFTPFKRLSQDPVARLRQLRYDVFHPAMEEILPGVADGVRTILGITPPSCAVECGAAKQLKRGPRWEISYRVYTPILLAVSLANSLEPSHRALERLTSRRGTARSNNMYHPLRKRSREERKRIMKAQRELRRWCLHTILTARNAYFAAATTA